MNEKKNAIFTAGLLAAILLIFTAWDMVGSDRLYSEMENRVLAGRPKFSRAALLSGEYSDDYTSYVSDQFVSRDKWVAIKTRLDILFQKKDIGGVYLGRDDYLMEQHLPENYTEQLELEKAVMLQRLVEEWDARVMLAPTADNILTEKLPAYAAYYDETRLLNLVKDLIGEDHYVDVYAELAAHKDEDIYYRTDHHWTSLGAYYGYQAWVGDEGGFRYSYDVDGMVTVSDNFQGTLQSKVPVVDTRDKIQIFPETLERKVTVIYDRQTVKEGIYEERHLSTKNQYGYFLDDNHGLLEISTGYYNGRTLFILKDSYANCLIPLLMPYYETIYVADPRYYKGALPELMEECEPEKGMDVLVIYNCVHFLENFRY